MFSIKHQRYPSQSPLPYHLQYDDYSLDIRERTSPIRMLLRIERSRQPELVPRNITCPLRTPHRRHTALAAGKPVTILSAQPGAVNIRAEDVVEDACAIVPGRIWVVGCDDVESMALGECEAMSGGGHGRCCCGLSDMVQERVWSEQQYLPTGSSSKETRLYELLGNVWNEKILALEESQQL